jgi:hypothetical protein
MEIIDDKSYWVGVLTTFWVLDSILFVHLLVNNYGVNLLK